MTRPFLNDLTFNTSSFYSNPECSIKVLLEILNTLAISYFYQVFYLPFLSFLFWNLAICVRLSHIQFLTCDCCLHRTVENKTNPSSSFLSSPPHNKMQHRTHRIITNQWHIILNCQFSGRMEGYFFPNPPIPGSRNSALISSKTARPTLFSRINSSEPRD